MTRDEVLRQRIIDAAAELFAENGHGGTTLSAVAKRAGTSPRAVRRLVGDRAQLFAAVIDARLTSEAAERLAAAAADPQATPPLAVLLQAAARIFAAPERSWGLLELEVLMRAHRDDDVRTAVTARMRQRQRNMMAVIEQTRHAGGINEHVNDEALAHFSLALSVGLAMLEPAVDHRPSQASWNALMAQIGAAFAPVELLLAAEHEARTPWRLRVDIPDRPGGLAQLIRGLSTLHAHVVATSVLASEQDTRTIDLALTVPGGIGADTLLAVAMAVGRNAHVMPGSADDVIDLPTRVLDGATEMVTNPGSAPLAAAALVEADRFLVTDAAEGDDDAADVLRLQWTADRHVVLHRSWAPFARAEKSRASALLRLSAALANMQGDVEALGWVDAVKGGGTVWIRLSRPEDAEAVAAMHERCSERTRYRRYLRGAGQWRDVALRWLTGGHRGATVVAMSEEGVIVGLGNVFPDAQEDGVAAEIAVIVEDAYQGRGIGTRLVRHMIVLAERLGFEELVATVLAENGEMLQVLDDTGLDWDRELKNAVITMRAPLPMTVFGPRPAHPRRRGPANRDTRSADTSG